MEAPPTRPIDSLALSLRLRPSVPSPAECPNFLPELPSSFISFRHPGYPDSQNLMLRLPSHDGPQSNGEGVDVWGVHYGTALWACMIIACNTPGVLSPARLQPSTIPNLSTPPIDSLLTAPEYYFYPTAWLETADRNHLKYAVCPSFDDWQFPRGRVPLQWIHVYTDPQPSPRIPAPSQYSAAVIERDGSCRVSDFEDCTETAHLVPQKNVTWFRRNQMVLYNLNNALPSHLLVSDIQNCLRLRSDIHDQLDAGGFVFVPKCGTSRIHFLILSRNYGRLYHNRQSHELRVAPEFLYARFALAVLPLAQAFTASPGVRIRVWNKEENDWKETEVPEDEDPSPSPKKKLKLGDAVVDRPLNSLNTHGTQFMSSKEFPVPRQPHTSPAITVSQTEHESRKRAFDEIVSADPEYAWDRVTWHPDTERLGKMKEDYLKSREPMHEVEAKRWLELLESGVIPPEAEVRRLKLLESGVILPEEEIP